MIKKANFFGVVKRFMEPALHDKKSLFLFSCVFLLWKIYEIANVYAFSQIVSVIQSGDRGRFEQILIQFLIFVVLYQVFSFFWQKYFGFYEQAMYRYINEKYLPKLIEIDNNYIESLGSGKVMTIITKGIDYWSQFTERIIGRSISILVILGYTGYMITRISWQYFIVLLIISICFNIFALLFRDIGVKYRFRIYDMVADHNRKVLRFIMSKHEIMQNNRGERETESISNHIGEINKLIRKRWPYEHFSYNSMDIGIVLIKIAIMYGMGRMVFTRNIELSEFVGIVTLLGYLSTAGQNFIDVIKDYMKNGINLRRFWEFLDDSPKIHNLHIGKSYVHGNGDIHIRDVSYSYEKTKIFDNFSLFLQGGTKTAFVGSSGSGKTTLIKLIAGYLSPQEGEVCVDENCLSETKLVEYYKKIGYLTQEPSIFDGTIRENLVYALDIEPEESVLHTVIRNAKCEFIYEFTAGLDTEIGEKGIRLSGGQRQRLAIAKIMLKNPDIVLLDEPTSALDSFNEDQINIALHNLFIGKTVIVIAHRLQTVKNADKILVFEQGKIVERGTHADLVEFSGRYKKMLDLQSGF